MSTTICWLWILAPEILLHIFSYLDIPDLAAVAQVSPALATIACDPLLHRTRLLVVAPARVAHSLYGTDTQGAALRPTVGDLVHRNVMRGLGIERQWRMGLYFYSPQLPQQYEVGLRLQRKHAGIVVASHLRRRFSPLRALQVLHQAHVLPDVESSSLSISRSLLPVVRKLKWCLRRDSIARVVRGGAAQADRGQRLAVFAQWFDAKGGRVMREDERVRLALCPDVRKMVVSYERLIQNQ